MKLKDKVAFVTGAARGQGASHAVHLAREGAKIVALDICAEIPGIYPLAARDELDATVAAVTELGSSALAIEGDVRSSEQMERAVNLAIERFGTIDILCNNAATCISKAVDQVTDATLDAIIDTNVKGVFNTIRYVAPLMKGQRSGRIINIASAAAMRPVPNASAYCASKGAVVAATTSLALELAEWDINVNCICPGLIPTGMMAGLAGQRGLDLVEAYAQSQPQQVFRGERGRMSVDDISRMVVFLSSEDARMITGQSYAVDAGWSIT
jgi:NAD(P)-dependent dehydrogenase (short-subunit alcohol dehydrogenase family)